jgi:hypothetical protein
MSDRPKEPRDVLADRIEEWSGEDWRVYDYADRLILDLDSAGFEFIRKGDEDAWYKLACWLLENDGAAPDIAASGRWVDLFDGIVHDRADRGVDYHAGSSENDGEHA